MKIILTTIILQGVAIGTVQAHMCDDGALERWSHMFEQLKAYL